MLLQLPGQPLFGPADWWQRVRIHWKELILLHFRVFYFPQHVHIYDIPSQEFSQIGKKEEFDDVDPQMQRDSR